MVEPVYESPLLQPPACLRCPAPLLRPASAGTILAHLLAHHPRGAAIALPWPDQLACIRFVRADLPARLSSSEAALLILSVQALARHHTRGFSDGRYSVADAADHLQEAALALLTHLGSYDSGRARLSTWLRWVHLNAAQGLAALSRRGLTIPVELVTAIPRLISAEMASVAAKGEPITRADRRELMNTACRWRLSDEAEAALLRLLEPMVYLGELSSNRDGAGSVLEIADLSDDALLAVLGRHTVANALRSLTRRQRANIAALLDMAGRPPRSQAAISRALGLSRQALWAIVQRGTTRLYATGAIAELDPGSVTWREQQSRRNAERHPRRGRHA